MRLVSERPGRERVAARELEAVPIQVRMPGPRQCMCTLTGEAHRSPWWTCAARVSIPLHGRRVDALSGGGSPSRVGLAARGLSGAFLGETRGVQLHCVLNGKAVLRGRVAMTRKGG